MTQWVAFAGVTGLVLILILVLSHLTQQAFTTTPSAEPAHDFESADKVERSVGERSIVEVDDCKTPDTDDHPNTTQGTEPPTTQGTEPSADQSTVTSVDAEDGGAVSTDSAGDRGTVSTDPTNEYRASGPSSEGNRIDPHGLSTGALLVNVAISQGLFAAILVGMAVVTGIPADALGIEYSRSYLVTGLVLGIAVGVVFYVLNEVGAASAKRYGLDFDEELRELLAPETIGGWLVLLLIVLPIIAVFEEFLFRAAMIGALSAGFGISPWLLAVLSSVAFALGHGMQGKVGVIVTGTLGFALAAVFIVTGSFLVVVVAHYLINALEFVVHEGFGFEWSEPIGG